MTGEDYTIRQLDQVAKDTGLPAYGTKVERFERLVQALGREGAISALSKNSSENPDDIASSSPGIATESPIACGRTDTSAASPVRVLKEAKVPNAGNVSEQMTLVPTARPAPLTPGIASKSNPIQTQLQLYQNWRRYQGPGLQNRILFLQGFEESDEIQQPNPNFNIRLILFHAVEGNWYLTPSLNNLTNFIYSTLLRQCGKEVTSIRLYRWETRFIDAKTGRPWTDGYKIKTFLSTNNALDSVYLEYSTENPPSPSREMFFTFKYTVSDSITKRGLESDESSDTTPRMSKVAARRDMEPTELSANLHRQVT